MENQRVKIWTLSKKQLKTEAIKLKFYESMKKKDKLHKSEKVNSLTPQ